MIETVSEGIAMLPQHAECRWGVVGHSQRGASHVRQRAPNQDAICVYSLPDGSWPAIVAVADGHGSTKSFRSHVGAAIAAYTAVEVCQRFLERHRRSSPLDVKDAAERYIPALISHTWNRRIKDHSARVRITASEQEQLAGQPTIATRDALVGGERPGVPYGSTLLLAFMTNEYLMAFQLGDGDILVVSDLAQQPAHFVPKDESLFANETTSLCQDDAHQYVRSRFELFPEQPPALVMLSTDGYANSFATPNGFMKAAADYLEILERDGEAALKASLPEWLEKTSCEGSGDDITVGIMYRIDPPLTRSQVKTAVAHATQSEQSVGTVACALIDAPDAGIPAQGNGPECAGGEHMPFRLAVPAVSSTRSSASMAVAPRSSHGDQCAPISDACLPPTRVTPSSGSSPSPNGIARIGSITATSSASFDSTGRLPEGMAAPSPHSDPLAESRMISCSGIAPPGPLSEPFERKAQVGQRDQLETTDSGQDVGTLNSRPRKRRFRESMSSAFRPLTSALRLLGRFVRGGNGGP